MSLSPAFSTFRIDTDRPEKIAFGWERPEASGDYLLQNPAFSVLRIAAMVSGIFCSLRRGENPVGKIFFLVRSSLCLETIYCSTRLT